MNFSTHKVENVAKQLQEKLLIGAYTIIAQGSQVFGNQQTVKQPSRCSAHSKELLIRFLPDTLS
jgi:predicted house-cleaning NTP pyrophosphatase (Maf/HAM1 superfamily)